MRKLTEKHLTDFRNYLVEEEKSKATVDKYLRDLKAFYAFFENRRIEKSDVLAYKMHISRLYAVSSVNSHISSINSFFNYLEWYELKVKTLKVQKQIFASKNKELTKSEYERLLATAMHKKNRRLFLLMQTICSTGIRVSELRFITVEAVSLGVAEINCKNKQRRVFIPSALCKMLSEYVRERKITCGPVFITRSNTPIDRSNVWSDMKRICKQSGIAESKVFPHNLRHLFARTYYEAQKDVVRLADLLGHSSINTTRIYTMETGETHRRQIQKLGLVSESITSF